VCFEARISLWRQSATAEYELTKRGGKKVVRITALILSKEPELSDGNSIGFIITQPADGGRGLLTTGCYSTS
jgi:hypothetical protein